MPVDALPEAWGDGPATPDRVSHRRVYRDVLGRPMTGLVRVTSLTRVVEGDVVIPPVTVDVPLVDGVFTADLPPGRYLLVAQLITQDSMNLVDKDDVVLSVE